MTALRVGLLAFCLVLPAGAITAQQAAMTEGDSAVLREAKAIKKGEERAKKSIAFAKQYRTYVINYGLGEEMVAQDVERFRSPAARWRRFEQLISEPTLPSDLRAR